jgi:D-arabinose 1-dehydrogenase-like Zn-dependent alcohol dehydrogenase
MCIEELQVDYFVDYKACADIVSEVTSITHGGPHAAVVIAAAETPFQQAIQVSLRVITQLLLLKTPNLHDLQYIRLKGTVVAVGLPLGIIQADLFSTVVRMVCIKGSHVGNRTDTEEALAVYSRAHSTIPHEIFDVEELPMIYDRMAEGEY